MTIQNKGYSGKREGKSKVDNAASGGRKPDSRSSSEKKKYYSSKPGKPYGAKRKPTTEKPKEKETVDDNSVRLNKYVASTGLCSRREADVFIETGCISVNGVIVTELGTRITYNDDVRFNDEPLESKNKVYILLNKPKDYITTSDDPQKRHTVFELLKGATKERIYSVGRLDRMTTGLLLFTNDGELTQKLTHPKFNKKKIYQVEVDKAFKASDMRILQETGVTLEDGFIQPDAISYVLPTDKTVVGIEIHSGRNRIVRRIFEHLGYNVKKLDRVYFAGLTKKNLPRGKWRHLTKAEVAMLKRGAFE